MNNKQIKELIAFLNDKPKSSYFDTYWEMLVQMWNINNSDVIVEDNISMPDYTLLNK